MYVPQQFAEPRREVLVELIRNFPLATVVTLSTDGLTADHIPLYYRESSGEHGALWGHVARANPLCNNLLGSAALAIFQGPDAYISPSWYASKEETGRVVPTWNYAVVHAYGRLTLIEDRQWLREQVELLTDTQEKRIASSWKVADAPVDYIERMLGAIVGIELVVERLVGKWKVSQNQPPQNQAGVVRGLNATGKCVDAAVAKLVSREREST
jgi:transcriptional regulator